jgi:hypothetical protein
MERVPHRSCCGRCSPHDLERALALSYFDPPSIDGPDGKDLTSMPHMTEYGEHRV